MKVQFVQRFIFQRANPFCWSAVRRWFVEIKPNWFHASQVEISVIMICDVIDFTLIHLNSNAVFNKVDQKSVTTPDMYWWTWVHMFSSFAHVCVEKSIAQLSLRDCDILDKDRTLIMSKQNIAFWTTIRGGYSEKTCYQRNATPD